jgi:hypothetical protein
MNFSKTFESKDYTQIVVMLRQNKDGAPEIRMYFQPSGFGVCDFAIGYEREVTESRMRQAFESITQQDAVDLVDGYMRHIIDPQNAHKAH